MRASELKREIDKYLDGLDDGSPYADQATEVLNNFAEELYPAMAQRRQRKQALAKLTAGEIKLLGLDLASLDAVPSEDPDEVEMLREWIKLYQRTRTTKSNCHDQAMEGLLAFVISLRDDI